MRYSALFVVWTLIQMAGGAELLFPNSDFEAGTLQNWTASGSAFVRQPTFGDNTAARGNIPAGHQGNSWIGTYENHDGISGSPGDVRGDGATGTLTSQPFTIHRRYIHFLIGGGHHPGVVGVKLLCDGKEYEMGTGFDSEGMIPAGFDAEALIGKTATVVIYDHATGGWGHINVDHFTASDEPPPTGFRLTPGIPAAAMVGTGYRQPLRPQFHFTSRRNWLNDPNGMVFDGEQYHLFFQHNPLGTDWGNMTWGHAVSGDMIHWRQLRHALLPYQVDGRSGTIYSGTVVVDHHNSLGRQTGSRKTLVAFFTFAHPPYYQALAYSTDGGATWEYHDEGRAIVPNQGFDSGERDPKVFWHEESQRWVMALWVQLNPGRVRFFTSTNLTDWTFASDFMRDWAFECMDLIELPVDGDEDRMKWVIYDASFDYEIGTFDGEVFHTEAGPFRASHGSFYAAQTFNQAPGGRAVQIGWMNGGPNSAEAYGLPFNQQMSFPCDLSLRTTPDGVRLCANPIPEISSLVASTFELSDLPITGSNLIGGIGEIDLVDLTIEFDPGTASEIVIDLPGTTIRYHQASHAFTFTNVAGEAATLVDGAAAPRSGRVKLRLLWDRLSLEAYAFDGEKFGSHYISPHHGTSNPSIHAVGGEGRLHVLRVDKLTSAWTEEVPLATTLRNPGFEENLPSGEPFNTEIAGWSTFGGWEDAAGRLDDHDDGWARADGYPDFTGIGAVVLKARNPGGEDHSGIYQSLGHVALADVGKTFTLGADLGARIPPGSGDDSHAGDLTVSFRKGVTGGVGGNGGSRLGIAGTRRIVVDRVDFPLLENVTLKRETAVFTPGLEDVGSEVFAVIDLRNLSSSPQAENEEKHYLVDQVTLTTASPEPVSGLWAYEGFDYPAGVSSLAGRDGGKGWAGPWVTVNNGSADILDGSLLSDGMAPTDYDAKSSGNRSLLPVSRRIGRHLDTGPNGPFNVSGLLDESGRIGRDGKTIYLSFLQQANGAEMFYEFELHRGDLGDPGRIAGIGNDRPENDVHLRAPAGVHTRIGAGNHEVNFYVMRIDFKEGNDDVSIYRNVVSPTEPATATLSLPDVADLSFDGISFGAFLNGRTVAHDEIRIGATWASVIAENPYVTWAREKGMDPSGEQAAFDADPDGDSIPNGLEWIFRGNPLSWDSAVLWEGNAEEGLTLEFHRNAETDDHVDFYVQWSNDLEEWHDISLGIQRGFDEGGITVDLMGSCVMVRISGDRAVGGKLFARLRAESR